MKKSCIILLVTISAIFSRAYADKVILQNGAVFEGKITESTDKFVKIKIASPGSKPDESSIEMRFDKKRIKKVEQAGKLKIKNSVSVSSAKRQPMIKSGPAEPQDASTKTPTVKADNKTSASAEENKDENKEEKEELTWDPEIDRLISKLDSKDESVIAKYRKQITAYGKEATPPLIKTFKSGSIMQKKEAAYILGLTKDKRATAALIRALSHPFSLPSVSRQASMSLKKITSRNFYFKHDVTPLKRKKYIDKWKDWFNGAQNDTAYKDQINLDIEDSSGDNSSEKNDDEKPAPIKKEKKRRKSGY
ncbi:MAG: HEAT repeat domain-containing protein [Planctomycetota bacterium]|jgi:hypothetical protein